MGSKKFVMRYKFDLIENIDIDKGAEFYFGKNK